MKARYKRFIGGLLALIMTMGFFPVYAAEDSGLCIHHTEHTDCGYTEAFAGSPCGHQHDESCYVEVRACTHLHGDCGYVPAIAGTPCQHVHDANCGYCEGSAGIPCACLPGEDGVLVHSEGCGYMPAVPGSPCGHIHDANCGYSEGRAEQGLCSHVCSLETGCITKQLNCLHLHDESCGYMEGAEAQPCSFDCPDCKALNEAAVDPGAGDEPGAETDADPGLSPEPETTVPPVCSCESRCAEGSVNALCPVCAAEGADLSLCTGIEIRQYPLVEWGPVLTVRDAPDPGLPENNELYRYYVEQVFYGYEMAAFGTRARDGLTNTEKTVYDNLRPGLEHIADNGGYTGFEFEECIEWTAEELAEAGVDINGPDGADALNQYFDANFNNRSVISALMADMPFHMYWYDKTLGAELNFQTFRWRHSSEDAEYAGAAVSMSYSFPVAADYRSDPADEYVVSAGFVPRAHAAADNAAAVVAEAAGLTELEKLYHFKEYICRVVDYHDEAGGDDYEGYGEPFQLISVFDEDPSTSVVCEGYSKAFQYLCDLSDMQDTECICVIGDFGSGKLGGHMWNIVTYGGSNYLADLTNCDDGSSGYPDKLFLVGGDYIENVHGSRGGYQYRFGNSELTYACDNFGLLPGYKVNCPVPVGGSVQMNKTTAAAGETLELYFTPAAEYVFYDVTVTDEEGNELELTRYSDGSQEFTMPASDVTVRAVFAYSALTAEYAYNTDTGDAYSRYPTGMTVYEVLGYMDVNGEVQSIRTPVAELDNVMQYSGSSIRITGKKGIRMITSIPADKREQLIKGGLGGYTLLEYGTLVAWAGDVEGSLTLEHPKAMANYAYKKDVADPIFARTDELIQYTNVLVDFSDEQCGQDMIMRSYMKLQDARGNEHVIYGGEVQRSIGYIAWQNRNVFTPASAAYEYIWDIIRAVYGDTYDDEYQTA